MTDLLLSDNDDDNSSRVLALHLGAFRAPLRSHKALRGRYCHHPFTHGKGRPRRSSPPRAWQEPGLRPRSVCRQHLPSQAQHTKLLP